MRRNPYPIYEQFRSLSPLLHLPHLNLWILFDYEGVKRALNDHNAFSSSVSPAGRYSPEWLFFFDPPRHTKLRGLIMQSFSPRAVPNLEPLIRELSGTLLDQTIKRGEMDLVEDFSFPLPMMVIAAMLGIPSADLRRFRRWTDVILNLAFAIPGGQQTVEAAEFEAVNAEMNEYVTGLVNDRRASAGITERDDLLTRLVAAKVDGRELSQEEILGFFQLLLVAGTETTTNLINNAVLCLIENPTQLARLRAAPDLLPAAIEEVLRYRTPVQWTCRTTLGDVEIHGQTIPAGALVLAIIGSANRDPRQFRDPDCFDIAREPNAHIGFGHGIHFCVGAALSRVEARIAISNLLERMKSFELGSDEPWEPRKPLYGPARLPIRFTPQ